MSFSDVVVPINDARTSTTTERSLVDDEEDEDYDEDDEDDDIVRSDDKESINLNEVKLFNIFENAQTILTIYIQSE